MSNAMLNIYVRTVTRRMENGEELEVILSSYKKLTDRQKQMIRDELTE